MHLDAVHAADRGNRIDAPGNGDDMSSRIERRGLHATTLPKSQRLGKPEIAVLAIQRGGSRRDNARMDIEDIKRGLKRPGKTQRGLALALGLDPSGVNRLLKGERQLKASEVPIVRAYLDETDELHTIFVGPMGTLPIKHKVAAGVWQEVDAFADEPLGEAPITPRPDIAAIEQWAELVVGDSFDRKYPEGTLLHVRSAFGADPKSLDGKRVIVERTRDGGHLRERTVKEIVVTPKGKIELWPRSHNPRWSKPLAWEDGLKDGDTVEIVGVVLSATLIE
jgi:hypothetical protein